LDQLLHSVVIILYQPQDVVNVAAVVRAMSNFGLVHLRLVEPAAFDPYRIEGIAHHTEEIVGAARRFDTLEEAMADCSLVLGTAGRPPRKDRRMLSPRAAAPLLLQTGALDPARKVAVLFGREQDGLPNEILDRCHAVLTIPTHPQNRSLNLAQAALVVAYELWQAAYGEAPDSPLAPAPDLADEPVRAAMLSALEELLWALYPRTNRVRVNAALQRLRIMLMRAAPRREEAIALTNLCRHAARAVIPPGGS
jgi:tRNA/rRNA methyltransferase